MAGGQTDSDRSRSIGRCAWARLGSRDRIDEGPAVRGVAGVALKARSRDVTVIQTSAAMAPTIVVVNQTSACGAFRAFDQGWIRETCAVRSDDELEELPTRGRGQRDADKSMHADGEQHVVRSVEGDLDAGGRL